MPPINPHKTKIYDKLVRDKIPEIIAATGAHCEFAILTETEYQLQLRRKMSEELTEYLETNNVEELADLLEVIYAAAAAQGFTCSQLDALAEEKAEKRGRFEKRIFLKTVRD